MLQRCWFFQHTTQTHKMALHSSSVDVLSIWSQICCLGPPIIVKVILTVHDSTMGANFENDRLLKQTNIRCLIELYHSLQARHWFAVITKTKCCLENAFGVVFLQQGSVFTRNKNNISIIFCKSNNKIPSRKQREVFGLPITMMKPTS